MIDIKKGQLYSFHRDPREPIIAFLADMGKDERVEACDIVMEVTKIDGFIGVTPIRDITGWFELGNEYIAKQSDIINSGQYRLLWDPSMIVDEEVEVYGVDCTQCNKHCPDALRTTDFKCWACRNGF